MLSDEQINETLEKWSKKCNDSPQELKKEYEQHFNQLTTDNPVLKEKFKTEEAYYKEVAVKKQHYQKVALSRVGGKLRRQFSSTAKKFTGVIFSYGNLYNASKKILEKAKQENWVNDEGKYVYRDYDWRMDQVIPAEDWQRLISGIAKLDDDDGQMQPFTMFLKKEIKLPLLNKRVVFRGTLKDEKKSDKVWPIGATSVTEFRDLGQPEVSLKNLAGKFFPGNCFKLSELTPQIADETELMKGSVFTMGTVARITKTNETKKTNTIELSDLDDMDVTEESPNKAVFVSKDIPINFGEGSFVYIFGSVFADRENQSKVSGISATGLWCEIKETPKNEPEEITTENGSAGEPQETMPETSGDLGVSDSPEPQEKPTEQPQPEPPKEEPKKEDKRPEEDAWN